MNIKVILTVAVSLMLLGCVNNPGLGTSMELVKNEQIYNPNATTQNKDVVPLGSGERSQVAVKGYNANN